MSEISNNISEEYWDLECNMSKNALYSVLYAILMHRGRITGTLTIGCEKYTPKQNSRNTAFFRIKLPKGKKDSFESMSGFKLNKPPTINI